VGIIAAGGIEDVDVAIALLDAGAQRVSTNAAGMMVETLMGVAA
jgi:deoxyribose-phosphate aldolase